MKREREADRGSGETFLDETQDVVELLSSKIRKTPGESPSGGKKILGNRESGRSSEKVTARMEWAILIHC